MSRAERTLAVAADVAAVLATHGVASAVIGAVALAVHGYVRDTEDFDIATATDPFRVLGLVEKELASRYRVELITPDADDPLGGCLNITGDDFDLVQIVNFENPLRPGVGAAGRAAVETATPNVLGTLAVADLPHLIALKLYAGGRKNELDVLEVLDRHPELDQEALAELCKTLGLEKELRNLKRS